MRAENYQRIRLWAGITSIGTNLAVIWVLAISASWWGGLFLGASQQLTVLGVLAAGLALVNLPFDVLTGHAVEVAAERTRQAFPSWLRDWVAGRALFAAGLFIAFVLFWVNFTLSGGLLFVLAVLAVACVGLVLVPGGSKAAAGSEEAAFEPKLLAELTKLGVRHRRIEWFDNGDLNSVNGYIRGRGVLCLASNVAEWLEPREAALMVAREEWFQTSRRSIYISLIALIWLMLGIVAAFFFPSTSGIQAALGGSAVVTLWCFAALFVWPSLNRAWARQADRSLIRLAAASEVSALLEKIQRLNATDIDLPAGKTAVFHPIPPLAQRIRALS